MEYIKNDIREIDVKSVAWIHLAQDKRPVGCSCENSNERQILSLTGYLLAATCSHSTHQALIITSYCTCQYCSYVNWISDL